MPWTLWLLAAVIAALWTLLVAAREVFKRNRSRRHRRRDSNELSNNAGVTRVGSSAHAAPLRFEMGWFWLVISYHLRSNRTEASGRKNISRSRLTALAHTFYSLGSFGVLIAFLALPFYLGIELWRTLTCDPAVAASQTLGSAQSIPSGILIPGLTVPLRDWSTLLFSSFIAIAWHEAGHAFAAILATVEITSFAFILLFAFPGAYVALDSTSLESVPYASSKLRIIAAGIWHNLVLCLTIGAGLHLGLFGRDTGIYRYLGYSDISEYGVAVQLVNEQSPLTGLISQGQLITHLDDLELHDSHIYRHWDRYLLSDSTQAHKYDSLGFCIDRAPYIQQPVLCCAADSSAGHFLEPKQGREVCYVATSRGSDIQEGQEDGAVRDDKLPGHCLDPGELMQLPRCTSTCSQTDQVCVHPASFERLLRITVRNTVSDPESVIMYRGSKDRLWEDVKVGRYQGAATWMQTFPLDIETFWLYTCSISFSLALFNLLPLPRLDGGEILDTLLSSPDSRFAPILPLPDGRKLGGFTDMDARREGKLAQTLEKWIVSLQSVRGEGRDGLVRYTIQGGIAVLAGLNVVGNLYRGVYG